MTVYIVKFIPVAGAVPIESFFKTEAAALAAAKAAGRDNVNITDDFGITLCFERAHYSMIITNTESSAAVQRALHDANGAAMHAQGLVRGPVNPGSTMQ